jgi:hypothetical protein
LNEETRTCTKCGVTHPLCFFAERSDGYTEWWCRPCRNAYARNKYYNTDEYREYMRKYMKKWKRRRKQQRR